MEKIREFLELFFGQTTGSYIELRYLKKDRLPALEFFDSIEKVLEGWEKVSSLTKFFNVYFGVCPRKEKRGNKESISHVWALWVDLDGEDFTRGKPEALEKLKQFPLPPTAIVDSGHGYHLYWRLKEPLEISGIGDIERVEGYLKALSNALGGDPSCAEVARIMRLPGTKNLKDPSSPIPVTILECHPDRLFNLVEFDAFLDLPSPEPSVPKNAVGWIGKALSGLSEGNRNTTFARIAGRLNGDGWASEDLLALLEPHAQKSGFPLAELRQEVEGISRRYPARNSSPFSPYIGGDTETDSKPFAAVPIGKLLEENDDNLEEWCVEGLLPKEGVGILAGPPGYGKSWMLLDLAIECAKGGKWLGHFLITAGRVLYLDEESSPRLLRKRLRKLLAGKKFDQTSLNLHFCVGGGLCLTEPASIKHLLDLLDTLRPDLVIIDSLIRVHRAEENSASEMARVFGIVKNMVRSFKCVFLFADHQRKPGIYGNGGNVMLRGSSEKSAFVDTLLSLLKKGDTLIVEHSKSRYAEAVPAFVLELKDPEPGATTVTYAGEAEAVKHKIKQAAAREFLSQTLQNDEWVVRKVLVEQAKEVEIYEKVLDETLKTLEDEGIVERENRKQEEGRGGKAAHFRLKNITSLLPDIYRGVNGNGVDGISSLSQSRETETET